MHKCSRCGQEFEGPYCPNCGTQWQDIKTCPVCGARLLSRVRFCPDCGYSFVNGMPYPQNYTQAQTQTQSLTENKSGSKNVGAWIKSHLKIVIPSIIGLIVLIIMLSLIPTFIAIPSNGTYYKCYDGKYDTDSFIRLKNYKWSDDEGSSGKYKLSGSKIKVYVSMFGETDVYSGTVKNGVLQLDYDGDGEIDETYYRKNHKHNYSSWRTVQEATCAVAGKETHVCGCGFEESREVIIPHTTGDWIMENFKHWKVCTVCGQEVYKDDCKNNVYDGYVWYSYFCPVCEFYHLNYTLNSDGTGYIVSGTTDAPIIYNNADLVIPATYKNLPVTEIADRAFYYYAGFDSIFIPDSVTSIGYEAFGGCNYITSITIPDSVTSIGYGAFYETTYYENKNNWQDGVLYIGKHLITAEGSNISGDYQIKEGTLTIADYAFRDCSSLTSITIPDSTTSIGEWVFMNCKGLTSVTIGNSVNSIGDYAFIGCNNISSITIGNVTSIGEGAFCYCTSLTSIILPNSVTSIGKSAFGDCSNLTSVTIPDSVTSIDDSAFSDCFDLTSINYKGTMEQWKAISKSNYWNWKTGDFTIQCTDGKLDKDGNEITE